MCVRVFVHVHMCVHTYCVYRHSDTHFVCAYIHTITYTLTYMYTRASGGQLQLNACVCVYVCTQIHN
jgi:hypothetical protein